MRSKVMTSRPAARKGNGNRTKKTVAVATRRSEPIIQMVERVRSPSSASRPVQELPKKTGELPIPLATFVFSCAYRPPFLPLYLRRLRALGLAVTDEQLAGRYARWCGDGLELRRGEILILEEGAA